MFLLLPMTLGPGSLAWFASVFRVRNDESVITPTRKQTSNAGEKETTPKKDAQKWQRSVSLEGHTEHLPAASELSYGRCREGRRVALTPTTIPVGAISIVFEAS